MTKIIQPKKQRNIFSRPSAEEGVWSWITTVDHKRIGIMYVYAAFFFLLVGGLEALLLRIQLFYYTVCKNEYKCIIFADGIMKFKKNPADKSNAIVKLNSKLINM